MSQWHSVSRRRFFWNKCMIWVVPRAYMWSCLFSMLVYRVAGRIQGYIRWVVGRFSCIDWLHSCKGLYIFGTILCVLSGVYSSSAHITMPYANGDATIEKNTPSGLSEQFNFWVVLCIARVRLG